MLFNPHKICHISQTGLEMVGLGAPDENLDPIFIDA